MQAIPPRHRRARHDGDEQFRRGPHSRRIHCLDLKSIRRTCFIPCKVTARTERSDATASRSRSTQISWTKSPGASPAQLQERCEACEGPLEDETSKASTSLVARRRRNCGEVRKPVDNGLRLWAARSSADLVDRSRLSSQSATSSRLRTGQQRLLLRSLSRDRSTAVAVGSRTKLIVEFSKERTDNGV